MEKLKNHYHQTSPLEFYEFGGNGYHAHFNALYDQIGIESTAFGGNELGAIYVYPIRVLRDQLICYLRGRGIFTEYHGYQMIPIAATVFYDETGEISDFNQPTIKPDSIRWLKRFTTGYEIRSEIIFKPVYRVGTLDCLPKYTIEGRCERQWSIIPGFGDTRFKKITWGFTLLDMFRPENAFCYVPYDESWDTYWGNSWLMVHENEWWICEKVQAVNEAVQNRKIG